VLVRVADDTISAGLRTSSRHYHQLTCIPSPANERTFLGYLRTSLALAMLGVIVAQLYRLQHSPAPDPKFGYFVLSKPISCIFHASAICVALLGTVRFFRQQYAMDVGKVHAGGWELMIIGVYILLVSEKLNAMVGRMFASADLRISFCWPCSRSMLE
jgi:uncharacterized membrane protein YidH (DUF202 family)